MTRFADSRRCLALAALVAGALAVGRCGGSTTTPTNTSATAVLQLTATPGTIVYAVCPPSHCGPLTGQLEVEATVTVRETAGVAATIARMPFSLRRRSDNLAIAMSDAAAAGGTRVGASGSVAIPIAMHFDATAAESNMKVVVAVEGTDANGHAVTASMEIEVRAP
jgi:hypothetical protein